MTKIKSILVIDDEKTIREVVRRYLELDGFKVFEAEAGQEALDLLPSLSVDLIILDIMLPGIDGFSITRSIRRSQDLDQINTDGDIPIILLTARKDEADRIMGFEVGADDYVVKPFSPRELVARVRAVLRRSQTEDTTLENPIVFESLSVDPRSRTVKVDNSSIILTAKEFDLLWFLIRHPNQVFTRSQLLDNVWGYEFFGDESTVTVHVRRLREKIELNPSKPGFIQTVWGVGYKFETSEVE
ncbi:response regulator transcription factor [Anaerolineales bacterium]